MRNLCPRCHSLRYRPEPYRWYERFLAVFHVRPFRCSRCRARFLRFAGIPSSRWILVLK